jgi:hypothetical protein
MPDYLADGTKLTKIAATFGLLWKFGSTVGVIWILGAIFSDWSWWWAIGVLLGAQFCRAQMKGYNRAGQQEFLDGMNAGQFTVDEATGKPVRVK